MIDDLHSECFDILELEKLSLMASSAFAFPSYIITRGPSIDSSKSTSSSSSRSFTTDFLSPCPRPNNNSHLLFSKPIPSGPKYQYAKFVEPESPAPKNWATNAKQACAVGRKSVMMSFSGAQSSTEEPYNQKNQTGVIIIGAGLAGLAAATRLTSQRIPYLLLEASDGVGGRVRTDIVDGFFLDRGFQIFITAYPEAKKLLDYKALDLQRFYAGAKVFYNGKFHTVADPLRHLWDSVASLTNPIGSVVDKGLIALTRARVLVKSNEEILTGADEVPTIDLLRRIGFSDEILDRFFRPFFGGIFFDRDLETTSKLFDFVFRCLALGENTLPAMGIGEIPNQLAAKLPANSILLNTRVASIEYPNGSDSDPGSGPPTVRLRDGRVLEAELGVIVAVEQHEADKLLSKIRDPVKIKPARSTICIYFTAEGNQIPVQDPVLFLNGSSTGIINNMFFATNVARTYAPPGKALVSVSLIGSFEDRSDDDLAGEVIKEVSGWFGESSVMSWKHLKTYRIQFAQPNQCPPTDLVKNPRVGSGLYLCGDYMTSATFDGALVSGRRAVEVLLREKDLLQ